ncbi:hypothetical protein F5X68DRAFT_208961 [Plectosphaerella plurivora]|uniref:Uncharacterized protein n=1 Tax=Plectosphaerella plurivora TaxID=936078 RepID=A0A9P9ABB1_9PEZI|nr:hypothetical protein F5X68DRAFT_208961 [Plectosphaerella plurivora]
MRFLPLLCTVLPAVQALSFGLTGPDASQPLNLSQPVEITWTTTEGNVGEPLARVLNIWFWALGGNNGGTYGNEIGSNLSLSTESYTWNPSGLVENFRDNNDIQLSAGKEHWFEAKLVGDRGNTLVSMPSDKYVLEGVPDLVGAAGKNIAVSKAVVGIVTGLAVLKGLL